jgi:hypothetical protein
MVVINNAGVELEGLAEALHFELEPFDISVTLIEPGRFLSALGNNQRVARSFTTESIYHEHSEHFSAAVSQLISPSYNLDPVVVAEAMRRVVDHPAPPLHVPVGAGTELTVLMRARPPFEPYADLLAVRLGTRTPQKTASTTDGGAA